jgi:DNA-binding NtrC family response regulator
MEKRKINIFIIDDDELILTLYAKFFTFKGLKVVATAKDGKEAILKIQDSIPKPDIILIDYNMPKLNGIETSKILLKIDKSYKIIIMSVNRTIRNEALSIGIQDFHDKSLKLQELLNKVKKIHKQNIKLI